ncbi:MAG: hypothetical protein DRR00_27125 [Candidatus Parabeggiatoa sp. nov. 3]|nr:MAG: hypothetical protein DRR00_27125 [Gammaproteobacteria bacterium]RKZ54749.1 MAG: hypothetical protein DRQ99_31000 [Gammaproteobacteria bacterium]
MLFSFRGKRFEQDLTKSCPLLNPFNSLNGGMVGKRAASIWVYIEFIVDSDPTLRIWGEKKVAKIPEI